jgi:hypothetical protein
MGPRNSPTLQVANEVYREVARDIECGRITPLKLAYCSDKPDKLDPTRCLIDVAPVLAIARRRNDGGRYIAAKLLAGANDETAAAVSLNTDPQPAAQTIPVGDNELDNLVAVGVAEPKTRAGKRGRKPGSGRIDDEPSLAKMLHLLATEEVASVWAAAGQFADGHDSTQSRLSAKFSDKWGTEPLPGKTWNIEGDLPIKVAHVR